MWIVCSTSRDISEYLCQNGTMTLTDAPSDAPRLVTDLPGPRARAVIERDERFSSPSLTRVYPLVVSRGEGAVLEDVDGNRFLDFNAGIAVNATGHAHPARQRPRSTPRSTTCLHYCSSDFYHPAYAELCERLAATAPAGMGPTRVFLANSGTEAVEGCAQARPPPHRPPERDRLLRSVSRAVARQPVAHRLEGQVPQRFRHRHPRQLPRTVRRSTASSPAPTTSRRCCSSG